MCVGGCECAWVGVSVHVGVVSVTVKHPVLLLCAVVILYIIVTFLKQH